MTRAYATIQTNISIPEIELNANLTLKGYSIEASDSIQFNRIHANNDCITQYKRMIKEGYKAKPTSQIIECQVCGEQIKASECISSYRIGEEIAVFSKEELQTLKAVSEGLQITGLIANETIKEYQKGKVLGLGLDKKARANEETLFQSLIAFLEGNNYSMIGYFGNRNTQHLTRVFCEKVNTVPALFMQILNSETATLKANEFITEAIQPHIKQLADIKDQTQALEVMATRKSKAYNPSEYKLGYKENIEQAIEQAIKTGKIEIKAVERPRVMAVNPFIRKA